MGGCTAHLHQQSFQGFNNDNSSAVLDDCTSAAAINTNFSRDVDTTFGIRFEIEETANCSSMNNQFHLQRNLLSAGWVDVTTTSTVVKLVDGVANDAIATGNRMTGSALGFVLGEYDEDGTTANITLQNQHTEMHFVVQIIGADVNNNDTIELRAITGVSALTEYHQIPTVTALKGGTIGDGDLSSVGSATTTGVGVGVALTVAESIAAATSLFDGANGASNFVEVDLASSGVASVAGIGAGFALGDMSSDGVATVSGIGAGFALGEGLLEGIATTSATSAALWAILAESSGIATTDVVSGAIAQIDTAITGSATFAAAGEDAGSPPENGDFPKTLIPLSLRYQMSKRGQGRAVGHYIPSVSPGRR